MNYQNIITIEPGKRSGKPCIRGLRITVYDVLEYLASGMTQQEILADFPDLTAEDIRACLAFAADSEHSRVKLLFDENLSFKLVTALSTEFPGSTHVRDVGLTQVDDEVVWKYA